MNTQRRRLSIPALSAQASEPYRRGFQIGPKIRVGGTLGKIGQAVKTGLGKVDKVAAPFVSMIPGVGQIAGPMMNLAGNALDTTNGGLHMNNIGKVGLQSALMAGGGKLLSGAGGLASKIPGVSALSSIPGASQVGSALGGIKDAVGGIPGIQGIEGALGKLGSEAGSFLTGNGGANALGAAEGINAALLGKQSSNYAKDALGSVTNSYNQRAPLRAAGQAGMLHPQIPDLSPLGAIAGNNPYARKITPVGGV